MKLRAIYAMGLLAIATFFAYGLITWLTLTAEAQIPDLPPVVIRSVYYDGYANNDLDEAVEIQSTTAFTTAIGGWQLGDGGSATAALPPGTELAPYQALWIARNGSAFQEHFGFAPDFETVDSSLSIPDMDGAWPRFTNSGDRVILSNEAQNFIDVVLYEEAALPYQGWKGTTVEPYSVNGLFAEEGQILQRKIDPLTNRVLTDTDTAADWIQDPDDPVLGKRVRYPGWDHEAFQNPETISGQQPIKIGIAPDNAFTMMEQEIQSAQLSIQITSLTFEHVGIVDALVAASIRDVAVTVLLEGGPAGGISDQERYVCQQLEAVGGQCFFMINDPAHDIFDRYRFMHAKYMIIDEKRVVVSSENLSPRSLPDDDKSDGTWGRRGVIIATSEPKLVAEFVHLFAADLDAANHNDLFRWQAADPTYGAPPENFIPDVDNGGITYTVRFAEPANITGSVNLTLLQAPDSLLTPGRGILARVHNAGTGDTIRVMQLSERPHWGPSSSNALHDPNIRLEAYIEAARRGAIVRLLLDNYFSDPTDPLSNHATCQYVNAIAASERLRLYCQLGNPSGLGIHNKMILVTNGGRLFSIVGSANGTEMSHKGNRETVLEVESAGVHAFLSGMFDQDWPHILYLPMAVDNFRGPADHLLISEVLYDPVGPDDAEFIEIVNPTDEPINLDGFSIGDAVHRTDFEDVRMFPNGTTIPPDGTIVVATTSTGFVGLFGFRPDFEILESDLMTPNLIDNPEWGDPKTFLQLGNNGDEVILRGPNGVVVDVVAYGDGMFPENQSCKLVEGFQHTLERFPYWRDYDDCTLDFRAWAFPNPGQLP